MKRYLRRLREGALWCLILASYVLAKNSSLQISKFESQICPEANEVITFGEDDIHANLETRLSICV